MTGRRAVFLDRDGVINANRSEYVLTWESFELLPGALSAICRLHEAGWLIVIVTNQSPIARGLTTADAVDDIHRRLTTTVAAAGAQIAGVYLCPHHPDAGCDCRKPRPGLLHRAIKDLQLDASASWLVGDHLTDAEAALAAGVRPILVRRGRGTLAIDAAVAKGRSELRVAEDLAGAADLILD